MPNYNDITNSIETINSVNTSAEDIDQLFDDLHARYDLLEEILLKNNDPKDEDINIQIRIDLLKRKLIKTMSEKNYMIDDTKEIISKKNCMKDDIKNIKSEMKCTKDDINYVMKKYKPQSWTMILLDTIVRNIVHVVYKKYDSWDKRNKTSSIDENSYYG
ncbi:hypothetical protein GUI12_04215 [Anaplasmataceae bacterium AB001_6]|nr:hypothetical protein GUI12_04215 [Anaplasmataceae bacterium AB001_6]